MNDTATKNEYVLNVEEQSFNNDDIPFSKFYNKKLKEYKDNSGIEINKENIANQLGITKSMFPKYIANGAKATKKRDCVIAMCMMVHMDVINTNIGLLKYGMTPLSEYNKRDKSIIRVIENNLETTDPPLKFVELNEYLYNLTGTHFDIIESRNITEKKKQVNKHQKEVSKTNNNGKSIYPYKLIKTEVKCLTDELSFGDLYDSLETVYDRFCRVQALMLLVDNDERIYELHADPSGNFYYINYLKNKKGNWIYDKEWHPEHNSIDEAGIFKNCFIELQKIASSKQREMADLLNDTRNYHERISAKVINNNLHVFYETYNYTIPELGEFYLMDYVNGKYTLYVSHISRFMNYYLSEERYQYYFGMISDSIEEKYSSIDEIEYAELKGHENRKYILRLRSNEYLNAQKKIDELIEELKQSNAHIRNLERIIETDFDSDYDILSFYHIEDDFHCSYDANTGAICNIDVEVAKVLISNDKYIELTFENLCDGFRLGLNTIEEVGNFLLEHNSLKISEIL